jgi:hypothetical protein
MKPQTHQPDIDMVQYLTECALATVDDLSMKKSRQKGEFKRQKAIAQTGIDWLTAKQAKPFGPRVLKVMNDFHHNVEAYSQEIVDYWSTR